MEREGASVRVSSSSLELGARQAAELTFRLVQTLVAAKYFKSETLRKELPRVCCQQRYEVSL